MLGMLLSYVAILFISNNYGAEVYGRFSLTQTLLQFLILVFSLGLGVSTVKLTSDSRFFRKNKPLNNYLKNSLVLLLLSSIFCALLLMVFGKWLATRVFNDGNLVEYFNFIVLFLVFAVFQNYFTEFLRGKNKFVHYGLFKYFLPPVLFIGLLYFFHFLDPVNEVSTFFSYILSFVVLFVAVLFYFPFRSVNPEPVYSYKKIFSLSFPMMFSAAFIFLCNWTDVFMLGAMVSKKEVGIYNAAYKLAIIALLAIQAFNIVLAPKISELYSKNKIVELKIEVRNASNWILFITIPMVFILVVFRKQLLGLFGEEFLYGQTALIIISLGFLVNSFFATVGQVLNMTHHQKILRNYTFFGAILNIILNYIFIKRMGIEGAALASMISIILINILCAFKIKNEFGFFPSIGRCS